MLDGDHNAYVTQRCHVTAEDPPVHCDRAIHPFDDGMILGGDQGRSVIHSLNVAASSFGPAQSHYATHPSGGGADPPSGDQIATVTQTCHVAAPLCPAQGDYATHTVPGRTLTLSGDQSSPAIQDLNVAAHLSFIQCPGAIQRKHDETDSLSDDQIDPATYMCHVVAPFDPAQPGYVIQVWNGGANPLGMERRGEPSSGDHDKSATQRERVAAPAQSRLHDPQLQRRATLNGDQASSAIQGCGVAAPTRPAHPFYVTQ